MRLLNFLQRSARFHLPSRLHLFSTFIVSITYCWTAEHTRLFEATSKTIDPRLFLLSIVIAILLSSRSWTIIAPKSQNVIDSKVSSPILPRSQTEETKGWMQAVILLYHYFGLSSNLPIYQVIRVLVGTYIFFTGYSHTTYFLKTKNFSSERTIRTLLRLNLLSCALAYMMNKSWEFYYFPGLTSFWYLVTWATLRSANIPSDDLSLSRVCICLTVSCALIQASLYSEAGKVVWGTALSFIAKLGGPNVNAHELIFRLKLDSLTPYWGASLAVVIAKCGPEPAEWLENRLHLRSVYRRVLFAHLPWLSSAAIVGYFLAIQQFKDKVMSNKWHPILSIIPITAMLALRHSFSRRGQATNTVFKWLGSISLETYILQSHVWLTNNNKGLLHLRVFGYLHDYVTGFPSIMTLCMDKVILTVIFLTISHVLAVETKIAIEWLMTGSKMKIVALIATCWILNIFWVKIVW